MNTNKENKDYNDKTPNAKKVDQPEVNSANKAWEPNRNPDSDNDRKGHNRDIQAENMKNQISGREMQTTPASKTKDLVDGKSNDQPQNKNRS